MHERFIRAGLHNLKPIVIRDGKRYVLLTTVYTEGQKIAIKNELTKKNIMHRIESFKHHEQVVGYHIYII